MTLETTTAAQGETIASLAPWFHNLHLPDGRQTAPDHALGDFPANKWERIAPHVPADLSGWRVLDIGCNAGFYAFELAKRGAEVTAVDHDEHYLRQARWAAGELGLDDRVRFRRMQVYDLAHAGESFDLVWFMGVFYHLRYPLLGLDVVSRVARRMLVFQSLTAPDENVAPAPLDFDLTDRERMSEPGWPKMSFIEHRLADDPTNWWAPNHACAEAMLRSCGWVVDQRPAHEVYVCRKGEPPDPDTAARLDAEFRAATGLERKE